MREEKTHKGYTLEEILWWAKRLGNNFSLRVEMGQFRMVFSHKSCGTQEFYGSIWTIAKNAMDALASAIGKADHADLDAFAHEFPECASS
ncbi:hypothetical protein [Enterobacter soli]|uniref:hypothetical protein n=1 Tax=Enterobacter soli TaxID=885040 RepID=UPI002F3FD985